MDYLLITLIFLLIGILSVYHVPLITLFPESTINIIFFMISFMLITEELRENGVITNLSIFFLRKTKNQHQAILLFLLTSSLLSAIIMNDIAIFIFTPMAMTLSTLTNTDKNKIIPLTLISVNLGSALSPIGNPQNIIIWKTFHITFLSFIIVMTPYYLITMTILLYYTHQHVKPKTTNTTTMNLPYVYMKTQRVITSVTLIILVLIMSELSLDLYAAVLTILVFLITNKAIITKINVKTLLILFLMITDFQFLSTVIPLPQLTNPILLFFLATLLSQGISNVPATSFLITNIPPTQWMFLAYGVNHGGTGLFIGSLANIIGLRISHVNLKHFHKITLPFYLISNVILLAFLIMKILW